MSEYELNYEGEEIADESSIIDQLAIENNNITSSQPYNPYGLIKHCLLCGKKSLNNFCCKEHESYYLKNKHMIDAIRNKATVYEYNEKLTHYRNLEYELDEDFNIILIKTSKWIRG